jgi:hypothetical protein
MKTFNCLKRTSEDWYPSIKCSDLDQYVEVSLDQSPVTKEYVVCAWGLDDSGMETWFSDYEDAVECFLSIMRLEDVTRQALFDLGLESA